MSRSSNERKLSRMIDKYGLPNVLRVSDDLLSRSERENLDYSPRVDLDHLEDQDLGRKLTRFMFWPAFFGGCGKRGRIDLVEEMIKMNRQGKICNV